MKGKIKQTSNDSKRVIISYLGKENIFVPTRKENLIQKKNSTDYHK